MLVRKPSSTRKCRQKAPCFVSYQWMLTAWSPVTLDVSFISDQSCRKNFLQNSKQLKIIIIIMSIIINLKCTRNTVDCDQSNYTSRIVFSHMILLKFGLTRNNAIRSADPVNPTLEPNMKWTVDRMTPCGDMAIWISSTWEVGRSLVGRRSVGRQYTSVQCESKKSPPLKFSDIFPKQLGIFSPNFTRLLYVPIYAGLQIFTYIHTQIFIQLPATLTKLCHIKRDHHYMLKIKMSTIGWNACWVVALNMA